MANEGTTTVVEGQAPLSGMEAEPKPAAAAEKPEAKQGGAAAPAEKTAWSKEEHEAEITRERNRYAGLDKKLTETKTQYETRIKALETAHEEAVKQASEARYSNFLASVEAAGGDMTAAQAIVTRERAIAAKEAEVRTRESWIQSQQSILEQASKEKQAHDMLKTYGLADTHLEKLAVAKDPVEMENIALKLHLEGVKVEKRPAEKLDSNKGRSTPPVGKAAELAQFGQMFEDAFSK